MSASSTSPDPPAPPPRSGRFWRHSGDGRIRALPIVLAIVLAVAAMAAALVYFGFLFAGPSGAAVGETPTGPCCIALGTPTAGHNGSTWTYTLQIAPNAGLAIGQMGFALTSSTGAHLSIAGAQVTVWGPSNCLVATYTMADGAWSDGPVTASNHCTPPGTISTQVTSAMTLVVSTGTTNLQHLGDNLVLTVSSGTVTEGLP